MSTARNAPRAKFSVQALWKWSSLGSLCWISADVSDSSVTDVTTLVMAIAIATRPKSPGVSNRARSRVLTKAMTLTRIRVAAIQVAPLVRRHLSGSMSPGSARLINSQYLL